MKSMSFWIKATLTAKAANQKVAKPEFSRVLDKDDNYFQPVFIRQNAKPVHSSIDLEIQGCWFDSQLEALELHFSQRVPIFNIHTLQYNLLKHCIN